MVREINRRLLNDGERIEYDRLLAAASEAGKRPGLAAYRMAIWAFVGWLAALALTGGWLLSIDATTDPKTFAIRGSAGIAVLVIFVAVLLGGAAATAIASGRGVRAWQQEQIAEGQRGIANFLAGIGYEQRSDGSLGDDHTWMSTRQMQNQWYGEHSDLDWRDRTRAEMYGMDVDTYISNVLEDDSD